ncbi:unnamed protein product, partial [Laminaria digitata]
VGERTAGAASVVVVIVRVSFGAGGVVLRSRSCGEFRVVGELDNKWGPGWRAGVWLADWLAGFLLLRLAPNNATAVFTTGLSVRLAIVGLFAGIYVRYGVTVVTRNKISRA